MKKLLSVSAGSHSGIKHRHGITIDQYNVLLEAQGYRCKICRTDKQNSNRRHKDRFYVDHDHKTGRIRGLLCNACNSMLGFANDDQVILLKAIRYLKEAQSSPETRKG